MSSAKQILFYKQHQINCLYLYISPIPALHVTARDICDVYNYSYTYCEDGYYCCHNNTRCWYVCSYKYYISGNTFMVDIMFCIFKYDTCVCIGLAKWITNADKG